MMGDSIRRRMGGGGGRGRREQPGTRTRRGARPGAGPRLDWLRWIVGGLAGAALAFLIGWLVATQVIFPKPALARDEVAVPDLTGMTQDEARRELAAARLELGRVREMVHPSAQVGQVIAQDPVEGQRLRPGAEVRVAVSRGRARAVVPDLVGMPADAALELARRIGLEPTRQDEPTIEPAGTVLRTQPAAGAQVEVPSGIAVVVSAGGLAPPDTAPPPPDDVLAPDVPGKIRSSEDVEIDD